MEIYLLQIPYLGVENQDILTFLASTVAGYILAGFIWPVRTGFATKNPKRWADLVNDIFGENDCVWSDGKLHAHAGENIVLRA